MTPILTLAGEFAAPYLIKEAGKIGVKKFIQTYGNTAWQSIAGVTGGMIAQLTEPVDLQTEKILGMPVSRITGQEQVYSDIEDKDKEKEEVLTKTTEEKLTDPTEPEPPKDPDVGADLAAEAAIHTTKKLLEDKELSVSQQTKNLIKKQKIKFRKHQAGQYFVDIGGKEKFEIFDTSLDTGEKVSTWQVSGQDEFGDNQGFIEVIDTFNTYREAKEYVLQLIEEQTKKNK